ncbi:branched-chain amino acid ABC transporter permease [Aeromicrobium phragmitis]|uniref:Branched-chain amino acid ABC transporter permease n=1 Tax=Aeromicrobium phragmitis TaxID=2478914 RepID=A0A3L8PK62_9ACTN|nr:branched-chain amino acid ABC transporter permease [Aeromicrobium phragmitis]RLV55755.1 branched-chain amino acid ABC transporter permease [Aeromicrobium phragmitis]
MTASRTVNRGVKIAGLLALLALALAFPSLAPDPFILSVGVVIMSYAVLATSWNFVGGFTGYISLGHAAYSGLGGYATALLILDAGLNPWVAMFLGAAVVAVLAVPIGIASLRVRGASFVIVSIALVLIMLLVFQSWGSFTGGSNGLRVPRPFGPDVLRPEQHERFFYLHVALLAVALFVWWAIDRSRFGIGLKAIREDEDKAEALGVPTFSYKLVVFVVSAFFTALGGGLYALWFGFLDPIFQFSILVGSYMVLMSLLGGIRSLFGPLLGAVIVGYALEFFKAQYGDTQFHLVALGLLLALVVLFMPDGIIPAVGQLFARFRPQAASIREQTQAELAAQRRGEAAEAEPDDAMAVSGEEARR